MGNQGQLGWGPSEKHTEHTLEESYREVGKQVGCSLLEGCRWDMKHQVLWSVCTDCRQRACQDLGTRDAHRQSRALRWEQLHVRKPPPLLAQDMQNSVNVAATASIQGGFLTSNAPLHERSLHQKKYSSKILQLTSSLLKTV